MEIERRAQLEMLFEAHAAAVRAYIRRRGEAAIADDVVSEVFVVAWRRLDDVPDDALPWLLGCAGNVLAHHRRRRLRDTALVERISFEPSREVETPSDRGLGEALSRLSGRDRELLLLVAWEGLTPAQAAKTLGCSRNALAVRLYRARGRLTRALAETESERAAPLSPPVKEARR